MRQGLGKEQMNKAIRRLVVVTEAESMNGGKTLATITEKKMARRQYRRGKINLENERNA